MEKPLMRFSKAQRDGWANLCDNLAIRFIYVAIIGSLGFDVSAISAAAILVLSLAPMAVAFFIRGYEKNASSRRK